MTDVEKELEDDRAVGGEHAFPIVDLVVAGAPGLLGHQVVHAHHQHVFVMRAVEDCDLAHPRGLLVAPPQKVVREFLGRRHLEASDVHRLGVGGLEDPADGAVLARSVHPLQHDEKRLLPGKVEEVEEFFQPVAETLGFRLDLFFDRILGSFGRELGKVKGLRTVQRLHALIVALLVEKRGS